MAVKIVDSLKMVRFLHDDCDDLCGFIKTDIW